MNLNAPQYPTAGIETPCGETASGRVPATPLSRNISLTKQSNRLFGFGFFFWAETRERMNIQQFSKLKHRPLFYSRKTTRAILKVSWVSIPKGQEGPNTMGQVPVRPLMCV